MPAVIKADRPSPELLALAKRLRVQETGCCIEGDIVTWMRWRPQTPELTRQFEDEILKMAVDLLDSGSTIERGPRIEQDPQSPDYLIVIPRCPGLAHELMVINSGGL